MRLLALALVVVTGLTSGCASRQAPALPSSIPQVGGEVQTAFSLRYVDIQVGTGAPLPPRACAYAHYTGWLTDGAKFDSSRDTLPDGRPRTPISFPQGARRVIAGWDAGFDGMRVHGQRRLFIPYQLAYGEIGRPPVIPARAALIFDVELMAVADTLPHDAPGPGVGPLPRCPTWEAVRGGN